MECPLPEALVRNESPDSMETHKKFQDLEAPMCGYGKKLNLGQTGRKSVFMMVELLQISSHIDGWRSFPTHPCPLPLKLFYANCLTKLRDDLNQEAAGTGSEASGLTTVTY